MHSPRQERWYITLPDFNFELYYIKGTKNTAADCLSRISPVVDNDNNSIRNKVITAQQNSPIIKNLVSFLSGTDELQFTDDISQSIAKCKKLQIPTLSLNKDLLMHENRLVIPIDAEDHVIKAYNSCGHFSANQTKKMVLEK